MQGGKWHDTAVSAAVRRLWLGTACGTVIAAAVVALSLLSIGLPSSPASGRATLVPPSGHADMTCGTCHAGSPSAGHPQSAAAAVADESALCGACHRSAVEASHPVGFKPDRPLPAGFSLDREGRMTCSTCHSLHDASSASSRLATSGEALCLSCHDERFFAAMADQGRSILGSGHLDARTPHGSGFDPYSLRCMLCHEDKSPSSGQQASLSMAVPGGVGNHPIGRRYQDAVRAGGYRPRFLLAEEIMLPDGRVGCVSCHLPYSREHGQKPALRNGICTECHML